MTVLIETTVAEKSCVVFVPRFFRKGCIGWSLPSRTGTVEGAAPERHGQVWVPGPFWRTLMVERLGVFACGGTDAASVERLSTSLGSREL